MINNDTTWQIHQKYMVQALRLAEVAFDEDEVPIGAIIVHENKIVGKGYNQVQKLNDPTAHAEMIAISAATQTIGQKYIKDATVYVTLEPCPMCAAALVWSKIGRVVYAASDASYGACGSTYHLHQDHHLNHEFEAIQGILEMDSEYLLKSFFLKKRTQ